MKKLAAFALKSFTVRFYISICSFWFFNHTNAVAQPKPFWISADMPEYSVMSLAINAKGNIFAGTYEGRLLRSEDGYGDWQFSDAGLPGDKAIFSLAANADGHLFAGLAVPGIFRSLDEGKTWTQIINGLDTGPIYAIAFNASGHVFAGTAPGALFRSTDNGKSWVKIYPSGSIVSIAIDASGRIFAERFYAGRNQDQEIIHSKDNGETWEVILPRGNLPEEGPIALSLSGEIFVGTGRGLIYRSRTDNYQWEVFDTGLGVNNSINALEINRLGHIFAGSRYFGIARSMDNGEHWEIINEGFRGHTSSFVFNSAGYVFAGSGFFLDRGFGVFRSIAPTISVADPARGEIPASFFLKQNFPNPVYDKTRISFTLPTADLTTIKVYDISGKEIVTLLSERLAAGDHELEWNIASRSSLPAGVYFYRLQTSTLIETKKLVLINAVR